MGASNIYIVQFCKSDFSSVTEADSEYVYGKWETSTSNVGRNDKHVSVVPNPKNNFDSYVIIGKHPFVTQCCLELSTEMV